MHVYVHLIYRNYVYYCIATWCLLQSGEYMISPFCTRLHDDTISIIYYIPYQPLNLFVYEFFLKKCLIPKPDDYRYFKSLLFRANLEKGVEVGSSFAAFYEGEPVVDIWGGFADVATRRPWAEDTLSIIFSATKGVTALLAALFVDR